MKAKRESCKAILPALALILFGFIPSPSRGQEPSTEELAKAAQNPIADLISVPFQNNTNFGIGPHDRTQNILNIQPVIPFSVADWNVITRTIAPVISQPDVNESDGSTFGLGDINTTWFLSPAKPGKLLWGLGPILSFPTATDEALGSEKWGLGPSAVVLAMPGNWVVGGLVSNVWSVAGDSDRADVNKMTFQYFVNYNFGDGWYLTSAPIITADWEADSDDRWLVPFGGGVGKITRIGKQPINVSLHGYYNVIHPDDTPYPDWTLRFQVQFLFPKGK
jgi:hypothetical protein